MSDTKYYIRTINDGSRVEVSACRKGTNEPFYSISTTDLSDASIQKLEEDVNRNATAITEAPSASGANPQFLVE